MKYLIIILAFTFVLSSCIEKVTDYDFQVINSLQDSVIVEFFFDPTIETETIGAIDTLFSKVTYASYIGPKLNSLEFNEEFKILSIKVNDSFSVSRNRIDSLNMIESWQYTHVEDIRYYQHHLYTLVLTKENLGM
ncbi:MAG: hypothetical protein ACPGLV_17635 [Bacteroidia bacterium]